MNRSRVFLRLPTAGDEARFIEIMEASKGFHRPWASAPTDHDRFVRYIEDSTHQDFEARLVCRESDGQILGFFNISQIVRGDRPTAYLGYAIAREYAGQGYMREAIEQVLPIAFDELGLDRLEANIQSGNTASIRLAQRAGFQRQKAAPRYLKIAGRWRDHERWLLLADDWRTSHR